MRGGVDSNAKVEIESSGGGTTIINSGGSTIISGGTFSSIVNGVAYVNGKPINSGMASGVEAVSGITVDGFVADNVTMKCKNDSINLNDVGNNNTITTKNGSIRARNVGTGNDLTTKNGSIKAGNVGQRSVLDSKNGSIHAYNVYANAELESKNGSVSAYSSHETATLSSKNGRVDRGYKLKEAGQNYSQSSNNQQQRPEKPRPKPKEAPPKSNAPSSLVEGTKRIYKLPIPANVNGELLSEKTVFMPKLYLTDPSGTSIAVDKLQREHTVRIIPVKAEKMPFKSAREMGNFIALNFDSSDLTVSEGVEFCKSVESCRGGAYTGVYHSPTAPKGFDIVNGTRDVIENRDKIFIPRKYFDANPEMWSKLQKVSTNGNDSLSVEFNKGIGFGINDKQKSADDYVAISKPPRENSQRIDKTNELKRFAVELEKGYNQKIQQSSAIGL